MNKKRIRIGIPSIHSRLHPKVMKILGLDTYEDPRKLTFYSDDVAIYFLRGWDIPPMIAASKLDIAFCGLDVIYELELEDKIKIIKCFEIDKAPIGVCKINGKNLSNSKNITIATEYRNLTTKYFAGKFFNLEIISVRGATETFAHLEGIDAIVDIVESGDTLKHNNMHLDEKNMIFHTSPCFVKNPQFNSNKEILDLALLSSKIDKTIRGN